MSLLDSGPGTDACFDPLALSLLLSRFLLVNVHAKCLPPSTRVYTSFVSDLVPTKSIAVNENIEAD